MTADDCRLCRRLCSRRQDFDPEQFKTYRSPADSILCRRLCAAEDLPQGVLLHLSGYPLQGGARALAHGPAEPGAAEAELGPAAAARGCCRAPWRCPRRPWWCPRCRPGLRCWRRCPAHLGSHACERRQPRARRPAARGGMLTARLPAAGPTRCVGLRRGMTRTRGDNDELVLIAQTTRCSGSCPLRPVG